MLIWECLPCEHQGPLMVLGAKTISTTKIWIYFNIEGGGGGNKIKIVIHMVSFILPRNMFLVHTSATCITNTLTSQFKVLLLYRANMFDTSVTIGYTCRVLPPTHNLTIWSPLKSWSSTHVARHFERWWNIMKYHRYGLHIRRSINSKFKVHGFGFLEKDTSCTQILSPEIAQSMLWIWAGRIHYLW